jgi:hypothetical protein
MKRVFYLLKQKALPAITADTANHIITNIRAHSLVASTSVITSTEKLSVRLINDNRFMMF